MQVNELHPATGFADGESTVRVTQVTGEIVAISLAGEFDMATAPKLSEAAELTLDDGNHLVIDLSDVTFIDSSMLNAVVQVHKDATARGRVIVPTRILVDGGPGGRVVRARRAPAARRRSCGGYSNDYASRRRVRDVILATAETCSR